MLILNLENTLLGSLGIETVSLEKDRVEMKMPVDRRTHQPAGFLHGGASVALAETAASIGATLHVDLTEDDVFGIEINANHVKSNREGVVIAVVRRVRVGSMTMVWNIEIIEEYAALICISRCTVGVVPKRYS